MYAVRGGKTVPQGTLLMALSQCLIMVASSNVFHTLLPQYLTFGHQVWADEGGAIHQCSITAAQCNMSVISTILTRIVVLMPFFGNIYFYAHWIILALFSIGMFFSLVRDKSSNLTGLNSSDEDEAFV